MPGGEDDHAAGDVPLGGLGGKAPVGVAVKAVQPTAVDHLTAQRGDGIQHGLHHGTEHVGAHVGLGLEGDVGGCAHVAEGLQREGATGVVDAGQELTVGKGARASRAELDVGLGVQPSLGVEGLHRLHTVGYAVSAVDEDGGIALLGQNIGAEQTRGAHAHHQGTGGEDRRAVGQGQGCGGVGLEARSGQLILGEGLPLGEGGQHRVDQSDLLPLTGVHRLFVEAEGHPLVGKSALFQLLQGSLEDVGLGGSHGHRHALDDSLAAKATAHTSEGRASVSGADSSVSSAGTVVSAAGGSVSVSGRLCPVT